MTWLVRFLFARFGMRLLRWGWGRVLDRRRAARRAEFRRGDGLRRMY